MPALLLLLREWGAQRWERPCLRPGPNAEQKHSILSVLKFPTSFPAPVSHICYLARHTFRAPGPRRSSSAAWAGETPWEEKPKSAETAACRQGCRCRGKRQFGPVKLISSAHTSLMGSNWLQKASLARHVVCSCLTTQLSDAEGSADKNKHGQGSSFCPKKHSQARSSSNKQCWQHSKDAVLWKMSSFPRLELFWARIKFELLKSVFVGKNSVFICAC